MQYFTRSGEGGRQSVSEAVLWVACINMRVLVISEVCWSKAGFQEGGECYKGIGSACE